MALTITKINDGQNIFGTAPVVLATLAPGVSDYATGGYAITALEVGLASIDFVFLGDGNTLAAGYVPYWNTQTGSFQVFWTGAAVASKLEEIPAATNLTGAVWTVYFLSIKGM